MSFTTYLRLGDNMITFTQTDGMKGIVLVLHGHYPTFAQLVPLHARWDQESLRNFLKQLQWFTQPFIFDDWRNLLINLIPPYIPLYLHTST